jgi:hypothetical protein
MKIIEFEAEVSEVGMGGVWLIRAGRLTSEGGRSCLILPTTAEEVACGKHLYRTVRVTVETIEEPDATKPLAPATTHGSVGK